MSTSQMSHSQVAHPTSSPEELNKLAQPERARRDQRFAEREAAIKPGTMPEVPRAHPATTDAELPPVGIKAHAVPARHPHAQR